MKKILGGLGLALTLLVSQNIHAATTPNVNYCNVPPYLTQNVKPNIHFVVDYTTSMTWYPYALKASTDGTTATYNTASNFYGYFDTSKYYKYDSSSGYWVQNTACTDTDKIGSNTGGTSATQCISGNLLNFVTTSKIDALRKVLTGGRLYSTTTDVFEHEGDNGYNCSGTTCALTGSYLTVNALNCKFTLGGSATTGVTLAIGNNDSYSCSVGTQSAANIRVKGTAPGLTSGIIPSLYPSLADMEISFFYGSSASTVDYIGGSTSYSTGKNETLSNYIAAINKASLGNYTNTGTAMEETQKYFKQVAMSATIPANLVSIKHGQYDPYYDPPPSPTTASNTNSLPAYCRKSFIILVSDGEWNKGNDPLNAAYDMHVNDQRNTTDLINSQTVTTYTVYAFGGKDAIGRAGRNAMVATALYGGFLDRDTSSSTGYKWPYPFTDKPASGSCGNNSLGSAMHYSLCMDWTNTDGTHKKITQCNYPTRWDEECAEWDKNKTGMPYNFFEADDGELLETNLTRAINNILGRVSSGTAASILGNNDNNGATLLQALFYPDRTFDEGKSDWAGEIQAFWYYIDPMLNGNNITIREDTISPNQLILGEDRIAEFDFDGTQTKVNLYSDTNGDGIKDNATIVSTVDPDDVKTIWRAGKTLWERDPATRTIFTQTSGTKLDFTDSNAATLAAYLDTASSSVAANYINYIRGTDVGSSIRNRTVSIQGNSHVWKLGDVINSTPKMLSEVRLNNYNLNPPYGYGDSSYDKYVRSRDYNSRGVAFSGANDGMLHAFKLGSNFPGGTQGIVAEIKDADGTTPPTHLGMELWAFIPKNTLPYLQYLTDSNYQHLYYVDSTPLLVDVSINPTKYKVDESTILTCDGTSANPFSTCARTTTLNAGQLSYNVTTNPTVIGASVGTSWRTLLLGSTGLGGATSTSQAFTNSVPITVVGGSTKTFTRSTGDFVTDGWAVDKMFTTTRFGNSGNNGTFKISAIDATHKIITCSTATTLVNEGPKTVDLMENVVKTPLGSALGYSSYFALDVTSPQTTDLTSGSYPKLLWEFSDPSLGFSTSTPAVVRIKDASDTGNPPRNGKWYAVIASGPTGPIDQYFKQNLQFSTQPLKIYVLDLVSGNVVKTFSSAATTGINSYFNLNNAFANSISSGTIDIDRKNKTALGFYSDDAIYIGYTQMDALTNTWTRGGVLRILTNNDPDPSNWTIATVIDGIGPVTSAIKKLQNPTTHKLWLFFGTGRYFYKTNVIDDAGTRQALYGILDPCYTTGDTFTTSCSSLSGTGSLSNQDGRLATDTSALPSGSSGWHINLANTDTTTGFKAERVISDPITTSTGTVFFTTFYPSENLCSYGGQSSVWAVNYDTGGVAPANLTGQLLIQLSTGAFKQINLATDFTVSNNRQTAPFLGVSPRNEGAITSNANHFPTKRILHIQER